MSEIIPPPLSKMKRRHQYASGGKCIYCRGDDLPGKLTCEHIIPESLGGMLELPASSCSACQIITSAFEGANAGKLFRPIRRQFNMGKKPKNSAARAKRLAETFVVEVGSKKIDIPTHEYPGLLVSFAFDLPTIFFRSMPTGEGFTGGISLGTLPDFGERLNELRAKYGQNVKFPLRGSAEDVGRLLAKIGHAYAVAELGIDGFKPYLLGIINGHDSHLLRHVIGSAAGEAPVTNDLHDIGILTPEEFGTAELVVVKIHLFSNYKGMSVHYVVAGERL